MPIAKTFACLIASVATLAAVPAFAEEAKPAAKSTSENLPAIRVIAAIEKTLTDRVIVTGSVEAVEEVYVQPQVEGLRIESLKADIGDTVKAGDVLATLSKDSLLLQKGQLGANRAKTEAVGAQLEAQVSEAKANEAEAIRQAERAERLVKTNAISVSQAEQLRAAATASSARVNSAKQGIAANNAELKVVDAQVANVDLSLSRTDIRSPVDGLITARNAKIGAIAAGVGNPLFTLIRDNAIELKGDVAEGDLLKLSPGLKVNISVAGTSAKVAGEVRRVEPVVDAVTRLGTVKISVDNSSLARVGMYASAEVVVSSRKVLALPMTTITAEKDGTYVRKIDNGVVKMTKVQTGVQDGDYIEITSGLTAKDIVVEKAGIFVRDGDRIAPVFPQQTVSN